MTHLNENIRLDSMKFLDLCLKFFPQLVKANPKNIILNFMNVISVEKSGMAKNRVIPIKAGLKAKVMVQKTQLEVLSRLNRLLCVVFGDASESSSIDSESITFSNLDPTLLSNFSLKTTLSEFQTLTTNEDWLKEFISNLSPVLFEYWVECCPAEFKTNLIPINKASVPIQIMKEILEIFVTLVESLKKNSSVQESFHGFLNSDLSVQFDAHLTKAFPLSFTFKQSGKKSVQSVENITDVQLNILVARLLCYHIGEIKNVKKLPRWASEVLSYIQKVLPSKNIDRQQSKLIASDIQSLTSLVKVFLLNLPKQFENEKVQLLQSMYCLFERSFRDSNTKKVLLDFLAEIVNGARNPNNPMITILDKWLTSLLGILIKENSQDLRYKIFFICKSGILQRFPRLTIAMAKALPRVFAVESFSKLSEKVQRLVIEVLYHSGQVPSRELYDVFAKLCNSGCLLLPVSKYLLFVIHQLVHSKPSNSLVTIADYLSFILSIAMGHTQDELEHMQAYREGHPNCYNFKEICKRCTIVAEFESNNTNPQITRESLEHANKVIEIICNLLAQSDYCSRLLEMLEAPLCTVFSRYPTLPLLVVYRLLYLIKKLLQSTNERGATELLAPVATWCAIMWHFLLKVWSLFGKANFIQTLTNHLQPVISELCKSSETILKSMLDLFIPCTMPGFKPRLACQVLTEMFKELQGSFTSVHQSVLKDLYINLECACNNETLDSQIFSDFKYQYQSCVKKLLVCDQI
ncbi:Hypothetical predicted protein [Paramuricea clavata]|uniref:Uncharacterized protein n=1 Tax=Paramuricea clavata TaxID=317549 RepID=A0A6S7GJQ5_PARCT|nr:Hypothetical predicted protein [Paramuricea clavata]